MLAQDHAAQRAALAVDIFGRGMHHDMGAEFHRPLQRRGGEGIVHHQQRAMPVGDLRHRLQIHDRQRGIGRRFQEQHARLGPHRLFPGADVPAVHQGGGDAEARQDLLHHMQAGAEHRPRRHHMIAGLQADRNTAVTAAMPVAVARPTGGAFQRRHALLEHGDGGIAEAAILIAADLALEAGLGFLGRLIGIAGGEKQRLRGLLEGRAHLPARTARVRFFQFPGFLLVAMDFPVRRGFRVLAGLGSSSLNSVAAVMRKMQGRRFRQAGMKRLYLLRHAKAVPAEPDLDDHARELTVRGMHDAGAMARYMRKNGFHAATCCWSPTSARTRQTAELVLRELEGRGGDYRDALYLAERGKNPGDVAGAPGKSSERDGGGP